MATLRIEKPGSNYGPCAGNCDHIDCDLLRQKAGSACRICNQPIGYGNNFYAENGRLFGDSRKSSVHAVCLEKFFEEKSREKSV